MGGLKSTFSRKLGLGNIVPIPGALPVGAPKAAFGKMSEVSKGRTQLPGTGSLPGSFAKKTLIIFIMDFHPK